MRYWTCVTHGRSFRYGERCSVCEQEKSEELTRLRAEVERLNGIIAESNDRRSRRGTIARLENRYDGLWREFKRISDTMETCGVWRPGTGGSVADAADRAIPEITLLRARVAELENPRSDIVCPFCHEGDFDKIGLKRHLETGWCAVYDETDKPAIGGEGE